MRLRIPFAEVMHIPAASRAGLIVGGVLQRRWSENFAPPFTSAQSIRVVERVPSLVTQDSHEPA